MANMIFDRALPSPDEIKRQYPISEELKEIIRKRDEELKEILSGKLDKLILIIGPCSADNIESVCDYIRRLKKIEEKISDKIFIIPRVYTNKPRTTGDGYKGMLHQPDPNKEENMVEGIISIRQMHIRVLSETGLSCADEMLYPDNYDYLSDLIGYHAVGARSVENQQHRLVASGIDAPVGMKNPTGGALSVMLNAIHAAQGKHKFIHRGSEVHTESNPYAHAILRGYSSKHGESMPNYHYEDLVLVDKMYKESSLKNPAVIVDCNHANSGKDPLQQDRIVKEVLHSCKLNPDIKKLVKGFMIESYIEDGNQKPEADPKVYGKSITDACLGFEKTEKLLMDIYNQL